MYQKPQINEAIISEDRKVMLISDVDSHIPEKLKKLFSLIDEVIETNKETLPSVSQKNRTKRRIN